MTDVFLSYASEDRRRVRQLYGRLRSAGLACWMDKPPPRWQEEGIRPGDHWDTVVRQQLSDAKVILLLLSRSSVSKRGYVQREFRLALQVAAERPPNTIAVVPVLIEKCSPPELSVDTISLRQLQWYELYRYGVNGLLHHLRTALGQPAGSRNSKAAAPAGPKGRYASGLLTFLASFRATEGTYPGYQPHELFRRALWFVEAGNFEAAQDHLRSIVLHDPIQAIRSLRNLSDRHAATLAAMMVVSALEYKDLGDSARRAMRRLLGHDVPEVELLAAALLARRARHSTRLSDLVSRYAASTRRVRGFHDYLRWHIHLDSLIGVTSTNPRFVWELVANNPQFPMKGMRFLPMMDEAKGLAALSTSNSWENREIGVSVRAADTSVPLTEKLDFLSDEEPRVRWRALQGILMDWHLDDLRQVVAALFRQPEAQNDQRSWTVKRFSRRPPLYLVHLDDAEVVSPLPISYRFGHGGRWLGAECADVSRCQLTGIMALSTTANDSVDDNDDLASLIVTKARRNSDHWIYEVLAHDTK